MVDENNLLIAPAKELGRILRQPAIAALINTYYNSN